MIEIVPAEPGEIKRIVCTCGEKLPRVGLKKDSKIDGLTFRCGKCGAFQEVKTK
jgi:hypothetical protein